MTRTNARARQAWNRTFTIVGLLCLLTIAAAFSAAAQVPLPAAPPPPGSVVALTGATVYPMNGSAIVDAVLIWRDGIILDLGQDLPVPAEAKRIDLAGLSVYPGLISAHTILGLVEIGSIRQSSDHTEIGDFNPNVRAAVAVNPESELIPVTRANGILTVLSVPRGGRVSGQSALLRLDGWTWEEMTIQAPVGLHVNWPSLTLNRGEVAKTGLGEQREKQRDELAELMRFFADARAYQIARSAAGAEALPRTEREVHWEAMAPVLAGNVPVFVHAQDKRQILSALDWAREEGLRLVIMGGGDAPLVADRLRQQQVPVVVGGVHRRPARDFEPYDQAFTLPRRLWEAGVEFCISTGGGGAHERNLPFHAAMAWSFGLPHDEALRAITLYPARILGVGEHLGSLKPGAEATLIVTDGDPLDIRSQVLRAFIAGSEIELSSRHTRLYEKYRQRP